jgi:hypothetical protein
MALLLIAGVTLSYMLGGVWFDSAMAQTMNSLRVIKNYTVFGSISIPWVNFDFFSKGIPKLLEFDFAFFQGEFAYIQYLFYCVSIGIVWGFLSIVIGIVYSMWSRGK